MKSTSIEEPREQTRAVLRGFGQDHYYKAAEADDIYDRSGTEKENVGVAATASFVAIVALAVISAVLAAVAAILRRQAKAAAAVTPCCCNRMNSKSQSR